MEIKQTWALWINLFISYFKILSTDISMQLHCQATHAINLDTYFYVTRQDLESISSLHSRKRCFMKLQVLSFGLHKTLAVIFNYGQSIINIQSSDQSGCLHYLFSAETSHFIMSHRRLDEVTWASNISLYNCLYSSKLWYSCRRSSTYIVSGEVACVFF